jgi:hypothetical protein
MSATARLRTVDLSLALAGAAGGTAAFFLLGRGAPRFPSTLAGHLLGALGLALMLWAGFGYSWRKRHAAAGGAMQRAMRLHVIGGSVGPLLVLLHSGFAFRGLAGVLVLVTIVVAVSGVLGRLVFTAAPRAVSVSDPVRAAMLDAELARLEVLAADRARGGMDDPGGDEALRARMVALRHEQEHLRAHWRQAPASGAWRGVLSGWWYLHVPLSYGLWVLAAAHVVAALWFATLSR